MRRAGLLPMLPLLAMAGCDSGTEIRKEQSASRAVMRESVPIPPGAVPRGTTAYLATLAAPGPEPTPDMIAYGRQRFLAFCSPCHGADGYGDGPVTRRGFPPPPSYHLPRLQTAPPVHIVSVITNGFGRMYSYADRIPPADRWAIAYYVKSLQADPPPPTPPDVAPPGPTVPPTNPARINPPVMAEPLR